MTETDKADTPPTAAVRVGSLQSLRFSCAPRVRERARAHVAANFANFQLDQASAAKRLLSNRRTVLGSSARYCYFAFLGSSAGLA